MVYENLIIARDQLIGSITLNRPEQLNTFTTPLAGELCQALKELDVDPQVRVILLKGAGKAFCAGKFFTLCQKRTDKARNMTLFRRPSPKRKNSRNLIKRYFRLIR